MKGCKTSGLSAKSISNLTNMITFIIIVAAIILLVTAYHLGYRSGSHYTEYRWRDRLTRKGLGYTIPARDGSEKERFYICGEND